MVFVWQVGIIYIVDINNKIPTFSTDTLSLNMDELTSSDYVFPLNIFVFDMDEVRAECVEGC